MLMRLFLILGLVLLGGTGWFIVVSRPPTVQLMPEKAMTYRLQESGFLPKGAIPEDEAIEEAEIFEVPAMDEMMLDAAMKNMGDMPGMNMGEGADGSMKMEPGSGTMKMAEGSGESMNMETGTTTMNMAEGSDNGKVLDMDMNGDGVMDMASSDMAGMNMSEGSDKPMNMETGNDTMNMGDTGTPMAMGAECKEDGGLSFCKGAMGEVDRDITLSMREWGFDKMNIEVKKGEKIRLTVRNDGQTLHEFMFMTMPLMQAVEYRAKRADWSLYEHEALFEQALLLPGQEMTVDIEVQQTGSWMFMCMLPYHMQMGMMGQMSTPGAAMKM